MQKKHIFRPIKICTKNSYLDSKVMQKSPEFLANYELY